MKMKQKTRTWHLVCCMWIGQSKLGMKAIKARPEGGKYIPATQLPQHVKDAFDLDESSRYVRCFLGKQTIPTLEMSGAKVTNFRGIFYRITFDVTRSGKNIILSELAKNRKRDELGRFINE